MTEKTVFWRWGVMAVLVLPGLAPGAIQAQSIWPERAENLQELPEDFPPERLRAVMTGFSRALGVRCSYCHVGEEGQPLSTFDFASDENRNKAVARRMLNLLGDINERLAAIDPSGPERVNMWCHTCHSGKPRPLTLGEAMGETYRADGGDAAVERFLQLRASYFGGSQYDFRPSNVNRVASSFFEQGDTMTALSLFELNVEHHPDWAEGWESLGDVAAARGLREEAIRHYERALELAPDHPRILRSLEALRGG
jgi:tetratricopeptide (TPR) repeat protein